jgi:hypothetical protein
MFFNTLPPDLIDLLLSFSPDLCSLVAFAQISKHVYHVYQARFRSIRTSVAVNEVGDAFPQAIRLARFQRELDGDLHRKFDVREFHLAIPDETKLDMTVADWKEAAILSKNAETLKQFELFYSRRCAYATSLSTRNYILQRKEGSRTVCRPAQLYPALNHYV